MKVSQINNAALVFNGLFSKEQRYDTEFGTDLLKDYRKRTYFPFKDESESVIEKVLKESGYEYYYSIDTLCSPVTKVIVNSERGERLPFTQAEYKNYKKFLGKDMPEQISAVKNALIANKLNHYINKGPIFAIKKFLHSIKII